MKKFLMTATLCLAAQVAMAAPFSVTTGLYGDHNAPMEKYNLSMRYPVVAKADNTVAAEKINSYYIAEIDKLKQAYVKEATEEGAVKREDMDFRITLNDDDYLCVIKQGYTYYKQAAHPQSYQEGQVFANATGAKLAWQEVLAPEDVKKLTLEAINEKIMASKYAKNKWLYPDFKGLEELPANYYLDKDRELHFLFGQYEIAPYAVGFIDIDMGVKAK